jgi:predicted RNase H-like nuclease
MAIALGVDGCKGGWFFFRLEGSDMSFGVVESAHELLPQADEDGCILIDIPIGILESGESERTCDLAARRALSPKRGSSVFPTPCRQALSAGSYEDALSINRRILGRGLTKQSWAIVPKIREVDELLANNKVARHSIRETHPEVCFWGLAGGPMEHPKKTREGFLERMRILKLVDPRAEQMIAVAFLTHGGFEAARDDVVDAFVAAICARAAPNLKTLPETPEDDLRGLPMEMVYLPGINSVR